MLVKMNIWEKDIKKVKKQITSALSSLVEDKGLHCGSYFINKSLLKPQCGIFSEETEARYLINMADRKGNLKKIKNHEGEIAFSVDICRKNLIMNYQYFKSKAWNLSILRNLAGVWSKDHKFPQDYYEFAIHFIEEVPVEDYQERVKNCLLNLRRNP